MTDLTGLSEITYGNFSFGTGPRVSSHVELKPIYDRAGRTVIATTYIINVRAIITSDDGTQKAGAITKVDTADLTMAKLERELMKPGQALVYSGWGHGTFSINTASDTKDVRFGPKPKYARVELVGSTLAIQVDWTVEVTINRCNPSTNAVYGRIGDISSLSYTESFSINDRGLTTRSINGHLDITNNRSRLGSNSVLTNADQFRSRFQVDVPNTFKRVTNQWALSEDKSSVSFSIVDQERPSSEGYPPGVTDCNLQHTANYRLHFGKGRGGSPPHTGQISGQLDVVKTVPLGDAWTRVLLMLRTRLTAMRNRGNTVFISELNVTEDLFRHGLSFSLRYYLLPKDKVLVNMAVKNALFTGSPTTSESEWKGSLNNTAYHQRGVARMEAKGDTIVDPCNQPGIITVQDRINFNNNVAPASSLGNIYPAPKQSYLLWDSWLEIKSQVGEQAHHIMPEKNTGGNLSARSVMESILNLGGSITKRGNLSPGGGGGTGIGSSSQIITQIDGSNDVTVLLKGAAIRVGYEPEIPSLVSIWDRKDNLVPIGVQKNDLRVIGEMGDIPVYQRRWISKYRVHFDSPIELQQALEDGLSSAVLATPDDLEGFKVLHGTSTRRQ